MVWGKQQVKMQPSPAQNRWRRFFAQTAVNEVHLVGWWKGRERCASGAVRYASSAASPAARPCALHRAASARQ
jgi:hypothetical protein